MQKQRVRFLIGFAVLIAIVFIYRYPLMNLVFVHSIGCSHSVLSEAMSPDGQYIATAFERNCGAVTPYTRVVSIRHRGKPILMAKMTVLGFSVIVDQPTIQIRWSAKDS